MVFLGPGDSSTCDNGTTQGQVEAIIAYNTSSMNSNYCFNEKSTQPTMERKLQNRLRGQREAFEMI